MPNPATANIFEEGLEQLRTAVERVDGEFRRFQKRAERSGERLRRDLRKRGRARWREAQKQIEKLQREASQRFEQGLERTLAILPIASKRDLARVDRKLNQVRRKLRDLEKSQTPSPPPSA